MSLRVQREADSPILNSFMQLPLIQSSAKQLAQEILDSAERALRIHLVNPSHRSFGTAIITPRWLFVLAAATPASFGEPNLVDESLHPVDAQQVRRGDVVGISIHTGNALRGYEIGKMLRERGAYVVFGGIHATLYAEEASSLGGAHAVVKLGSRFYGPSP